MSANTAKDSWPQMVHISLRKLKYGTPSTWGKAHFVISNFTCIFYMLVQYVAHGLDLAFPQNDLPYNWMDPTDKVGIGVSVAAISGLTFPRWSPAPLLTHLTHTYIHTWQSEAKLNSRSSLRGRLGFMKEHVDLSVPKKTQTHKKLG